MPTPRALLLLICPLLLLALAGPLTAAQALTAFETEISRQAADQEALHATVAEQGREVDRLTGKVDGLGRPRFGGHLDSRDGNTESRCER